MNKRTGCMFTGFFLLAGLFIIGLLAVGWLSQRQEQARLDFLPPIVQITEPQDGIKVSAGSHLPVAANIFNTPESPLQKVEVWLDGELQEKQEAAVDGELPPFLDTHLLIPSEGVHVLMVRAVNRLGMIGQSEPLIVVGIPKPQDVKLLVPLPEGGDLAGLAAAYNTDEATLQALNPALGGQPPAPGAIIAVPNLAEDEPPPAQPAQPLPPPASFPAINPATLPLDPAGLPGWGLTVLQLKPPDAPSGLQAQVIDCKVTLAWNDNSSDENGYNIWIKGANLPAHIIGALQPSKGGQTWYKFSAPASGSLMLWVEAFNIIGGQPSNIAVINVDAMCPASLPTHLQVELLDMSLGGNYNQAYCYISLEGALETRMPEQDGNFIPIQGGKANFGALPHTFSIPIPGDNSLEVSGECWAWAGGTLVKLGTFNGAFPMQAWNGARQELDGGAFKIGLAISALGAVKVSGALAYDKFPDPLLPPPYNVQEEGAKCPSFNCGAILTWKWQPSTAFKGQLTGFDIYLDGKLYKSVTDPQARSAPVIPPSGCGKPVRWQVAAVSGTTRSMLSLPFEYDLPPCQAYAVVKFETLEIPWTGDGISDGPCDEIELYYSLDLYSLDLPSIYGQDKKYFGYGGENAYPTIFNNIGTGYILSLKPITCTKNAPPYTFAELGRWFDDYQYPDTFIVPIPDTKLSIEIVTTFFDYDNPGTNDQFGTRFLDHKYPDLQSAVKELGCGKIFRDPPEDFRIENNADTAVTYTLTVYPNPCGDVPQGIPLPKK